MDSPANAATYSQFTWNQYSSMSHKFCSRGLNFSSGKFGEAEQQRFQTCLGKYDQAFSLFKQEQNVHFDALAAIDKIGGDRYAKLNEYDRY